MYELAGKSIVVTGAASGIGRAVALELAREGAQLTLSDLVDARVHAVADEARELGADVRAVSGDVSDESHVVATVELALSSFGSLYGAVNNAVLLGRSPRWLKSRWPTTCG
jgi:3-oxoacyl-[acyl-carrier protein] reductase